MKKFTEEQKEALERLEDAKKPIPRYRCKGLIGKLFGHKYVERGLPNGVNAYLECTRCGDVIE